MSSAIEAQTRVEPLWDLSVVPGWAVPIIIIGIFSLLGTLLYFLIGFVTAGRGWSSYAMRHRGETEFPAGVQTFGGQSMMIGGNIAPANYRHIVTVGLGDDGIRLKMGSIFKRFHKPVFVPWEAVDSVTQESAIVGVYTAVNVRHLPRLVFFKGLGDATFAKWQARR